MIEQLRRRRKQTRTQRRALATVLLLQRAWTKATDYRTPQREPKYIGWLMSLACREADKIGAMEVWDFIHMPDNPECLCDACFQFEEDFA